MSQHMHPAHAYLRLAEGPEDLLENQVSLTRRVLTLAVAFVLFSGTSLFALAAFDLDQAVLGKALAASGPGQAGSGDEDNSGPGGGDDDDDEATDTDTDTLATQSGDSNSNDNGGNTDSSHGASVSNRSQATSDGPGDRSRG